jgi:hypothetical protein
MQHMRAIVHERNIYRWAGTLMEELCRIRTGPGLDVTQAPLRVVPKPERLAPASELAYPLEIPRTTYSRG